MDVFGRRGHTVAILSDLDLTVAWADFDAENHLRVLRFGTNLMSYSMTNWMCGQLW